MQFYKDGQWLNYDLIPRKHVDPVRKLILRHQTDLQGTSWDEYADLLFVGDPDDMGLLAKAAPWVIYKRNTTADWAQFSEVFGMPIREYIYDTDDDDARQRAIDDAENTGSLAVLIHSKDSEMKLVESGNKTGSADLYERLCERCNNEISKLILGNTLTTEASDKGTQALGTVHKKGEDRMAEADHKYLLNVLNYEMTDIFTALGINASGGEFFFPNPKDIDLTAKANMLVQLRQTFNLPVDDDYLYSEFGIEKPKDYAQQKELLSAPRTDANSRVGACTDSNNANSTDAMPAVSNNANSRDGACTVSNNDDSTDAKPAVSKPKRRKNPIARLFSFFVRAPRAGASAWD